MALTFFTPEFLFKSRNDDVNEENDNEEEGDYEGDNNEDDDDGTVLYMKREYTDRKRKKQRSAQLGIERLDRSCHHMAFSDIYRRSLLWNRCYMLLYTGTISESASLNKITELRKTKM
ncbi:unnamed protein product [Dovyalis caffra]|uniref:Uncharacterized protein n=1 Tax=Dovyalis caffra TaxID=77055 RepID=A0AAV1SK09_9ROSI|nr:unnamed protein product [Dovyalis caffra]